MIHINRTERKEYRRIIKQALYSNIPFLSILICFIIKRKTKEYFSFLVLTSAKFFGNITRNTYVAASMTELLFTAALIHKVVEDNPVQKVKWYSLNKTLKSKFAVLIGDYLLAKGLLLAVDQTEYEILRTISSAVKALSEGEILKLYYPPGIIISENEYLELIHLKGSVLISCCLECGALSTGSSIDTINRFSSFGKMVGLAFQLSADAKAYKGYYQSDNYPIMLLNNTAFNLPFVHSYELANDADKKILYQHFIDTKKYLPLKHMINIINKYNGYNYTQELYEKFITEAIDYLNEFPNTEDKHQFINAILHKMNFIRKHKNVPYNLS